MIPKIIHYCWLSADPVPENLQKYMQTWKEKLSDYEFILWNFDRFDINSSLWVKQAFENKKYAFAADYIRLYAVYNYGGIYLDMDIEVLKCFDDLLNSPLMIAYENGEKTGIEAGCFGAEKGNGFISECLTYYKNRHFIKEDGSFDVLPLPKIMIGYVKEYGDLQIHSSDFFTCKSLADGTITTSENSYAIHNFAGSWLESWIREVREYAERAYSVSKNKKIARIKAVFFHFRKSFSHYGLIKGCSYWLKIILERLAK